jgi:hypothetical protein
MRVQIIRSLPDILDVVQDSRVRALRWDAVRHAFVLDVDCALDTRQQGEPRTATICRGWIVVQNAQNLAIHIDWNEFREGFSIVDIQEGQARDSSIRKEFRFNLDFPEGSLTLSGERIVLARSTSSGEVRGLELPADVRNSLATDAELASALSE